MKPRIALLFKTFGHPLQLAWAEWARDLHASADLEVGIFAHSSVDVPSMPPVMLVGRGSRKGRVRRLMRSPADIARLSASCIGRSARVIRSRIGTALDYGPLVEFRPDVACLVHAQQYPQYAELLDALQCSVISCYRGYDVQVRPEQDAGWHDVLRRLSLRSARMHFVSKRLLQSHTQLLPLDELREKRRVIYHGVDTRYFSPVAREANAGSSIRMLIVGRLIWEKGHVYAIRALRALRDQGRQVHLSIVGEGPDREHLAYWIRQLGLVDHVSLMGFMNQQQVRDQLRKSDIYLQPSLSEGLPGSLIEAAAVGMPIIATSVGGIPEVIRAGENGILVSPGEQNELALAIAGLLDDGELRIKLSRQSRQRIVTEFSVTSRARAWHELIAEALATGRNGA